MASGKKGSASRFFVWIILILLIVGLVGFGASDFGGTVRTVGQVGKTEIDVNRYARELNNEMRALSAQTGQNITIAQAQAVGIDRAVLQRLIGSAALENEATRIGISVGDEEVNRQVTTSPAFQGINGQFDREAYEFTLEQNGQTPSRFEDAVRLETSRSLLQAAVSGGIVAPDAYAREVLNYVGQRRSFSWVELDRSALDNPLSEPSDADLRAHYDANIDNFSLPEAKAITYAWLSPEDIIEQVEVDEAALQQLYAERDSEFNIPERRLVERLIFNTEDEATAALDSITAGTKTFGELVADRGLALQDIDLGDMTQDALADAGSAVFALTSPGIAGPATTDLGPAIFRVNAILAARSTSFQDAREQLQEELAAESARRLIADQITDIDDLLAGGATLEEISDETDMTLGQLNWTQSSDEAIAAYSDFINAASITTVDDFPEIIELDDGGIFAMRLDEVIPSRPQPYDDAVVKVISAWEISEISSRLSEQAQAMIATLENGASLSSLGQPVTVETNITRSSFIEGTTPAFLTALFEMEKDQSEIVENGESVIIVQLAGILGPDTSNPDAEVLRTSVTANTSQSLANDMLSMFTRAMETQGGISLNQQALDAIHAQFQ